MKIFKKHSSAQEAYDETTIDKTIAVKVTTYYGNTKVLVDVSYYSYVSEFDNPVDLRKDFPLVLTVGQTIERINQDTI